MSFCRICIKLIIIEVTRNITAKIIHITVNSISCSTVNTPIRVDITLNKINNGTISKPPLFKIYFILTKFVCSESSPALKTLPSSIDTIIRSVVSFVNNFSLGVLLAFRTLHKYLLFVNDLKYLLNNYKHFLNKHFYYSCNL